MLVETATGQSGSTSVAVVILTYNEEENLGYALDSVTGWAHEVFIVDSFSTDRTVEIAKNRGCAVTSRAFVNQAQQFNWALANLPIKSEWILKLDADEYLLTALQTELVEAIRIAPRRTTGFFIKRRMIFMGRWIRFGGYYPIWLLRLFRRECARSEAVEMDEHLVLISGEAGRLNNDFVDHNRNGLSAWTRKHEAYASRHARVFAQRAGIEEGGGMRPSMVGNQVERKRWLKHNVYGRLPLFTRSVLYFLYRYFLRLGFLDGKVGLIFHFLHAGWYLFYIDAKIYEVNMSASKKEPS